MKELMSFKDSTLDAILFYKKLKEEHVGRSFALSEFYRRDPMLPVPSNGALVICEHEGVTIIEYFVGAGDYIPNSIKEANEWAKAVATMRDPNSFLILMSMNGVIVPVTAGSPAEESQRYFELAMEESSARYRASPEYAKQQREAAQRSEDTLTAIDRLLLKHDNEYLIVDGDDRTLRALAWTIALAKHVDHVDVAKETHQEILGVLKKLGYVANDALGYTDAEYAADRELRARYIVGQAVNVMEKNMPIHPVTYYVFFQDRFQGDEELVAEVTALLAEAELGLPSFQPKALTPA